jgi:hypothetical protein
MPLVTVFLLFVETALVVAYIVTLPMKAELGYLRPSLIYSLGLLVTFVVRPIIVHYDPSAVVYGDYFVAREDDVVWALAVGVAATASLIAGARAGALNVGFQKPILSQLQDRFTPGWTGFLFAALFLAAAASVRSRIGTAAETFTAGEIFSGQARSEIGKQSVGNGLQTMTWNLLPVALLALAARLFQRTHPFAAFGAFVLTVPVLLPIGGRDLLATLLLGLVGIVTSRGTPLSGRGALFAIVGAALVALAVGFGRSAGSELSIVDQLSYASSTFDGFEPVASVRSRFSIDDVVWGETFWESVAYTYVPRLLWTTKPIIYGALSVERYCFPALADWKGNIGTFPMGLVMESLYNGWYFGLIAVPFAVGFASERVTLAAYRARDSLMPSILYAWLLSPVIIIRSPGDALGAFIVTAGFLLVLLGTQLKTANTIRRA